MHRSFTPVVCRNLVGVVAIAAVAVARIASATDSSSIQQLIDKGSFTEAEKLLRAEIPDPTAPVRGDAAVQLEILRRTRHDFSLTAAEVLKEIQETVPDATAAYVEAWTKSSDLQTRIIDGEPKYFREAAGNLFRFNKAAKNRQVKKPDVKGDAEAAFDLDAHVASLVKLAEHADGPEVYPVKHHVTYELTINKDHPRLKPGAQVRVWLPFPQEYRQQRDVRLVSSDPPGGVIADKTAPQRTLYFEQTVGADGAAPRFREELEFVTSAYCPKLDPAAIKPYDEKSALYRDNTAERAPHIQFTPEVIQTVKQIVGKETNPLNKALLIFRWVSHNLPWCSEMEYSIIPNLSAKGLEARRGDCGIAGMTFITLCRASGVPARWQSGWELKPDHWNMHDWSEFYVEPWGWLPADASYGVRESDDPRVRDFFCGHMDPYRMIVNLDYARELQPPKISFRSEPTDFQRGEVEIDGHNLYFGEWKWDFDVKSTPVDAAPGVTPESQSGK